MLTHISAGDKLLRVWSSSVLSKEIQSTTRQLFFLVWWMVVICRSTVTQVLHVLIFLDLLLTLITFFFCSAALNFYYVVVFKIHILVAKGLSIFTDAKRRAPGEFRVDLYIFYSCRKWSIYAQTSSYAPHGVMTLHSIQCMGHLRLLPCRRAVVPKLFRPRNP